MPEWDAWSGVADVMGPLLLQVPPKVGSMQPRDPRRHAEDGMEGEGPSACAAWATSRACSRCR